MNPALPNNKSGVKEMLRYGLILALICAVAAGTLSLVNSFTRAKILAQAASEEDVGLKEVLPQAERFEAVKSAKEIIYYKAYDKEGRFVGAAFKASGQGYSSTVETMVGMTKQGLINAIKVIAQNETPGLGARVSEADFTKRFTRRKLSDIAGVEAITGASISSRAVIESVSKKAREVEELIKDER